MTAKLENVNGNIYISNDVISSIVGISAMECYGLVGMTTKSTADGIVQLLKRENVNKGVKIYVENNEIEVELYVIIQFGTKISVVANNIIEKVKYNLENLTGMKIKKVNINIEGVRVLR